MWWYNVLAVNKVSILHLLWFARNTAVSILLTSKIVALRRENSDPILTVKRTEWRKSLEYFGQRIKSNLFMVGKKKIYFYTYWVYTKIFICKSPYIKASSGQNDNL